MCADEIASEAAESFSNDAELEDQIVSGPSCALFPRSSSTSGVAEFVIGERPSFGGTAFSTLVATGTVGDATKGDVMVGEAGAVVSVA